METTSETDRTIRELKTLKTITDMMYNRLSKQALPPFDTRNMKNVVNCIYNASVFVEKTLKCYTGGLTIDH